MDEFDDKITKMHNQINIIKHDIDSMKNKNKKTINTIKDSIQTLAKSSSYKTARTHSYSKEKRKESTEPIPTQPNTHLHYDYSDQVQDTTPAYMNFVQKTTPNRNRNQGTNTASKPIAPSKDQHQQQQFPQSPQMTARPFEYDRNNQLETNRSSVALSYSRPLIKRDKEKNSYHSHTNRTTTSGVMTSRHDCEISKVGLAMTENNTLDLNTNTNDENMHANIITSMNTVKDYSNTLGNNNLNRVKGTPTKQNHMMQINIPQSYLNKKPRNNSTQNNYNYNYNQTEGNTQRNYNNLQYTEGTYMKIVHDLLDVLNRESNYIIRPEEIVDKVQGYILKSKAKDSFITNIHKLYLTSPSNNNLPNNKIDLAELWKWIQKAAKGEEYIMDNDRYVQYCEYLINTYRLRSFEEMREFVNEAVQKKTKNEKFVEGMKKILCTDGGHNHTKKKKMINQYNSFNQTRVPHNNTVSTGDLNCCGINAYKGFNNNNKH